MGKLFNLTKWLTVEDTARHLSTVLDDEVSEARVLRFALDGKLRLSVNFVNYVKARRGKMVARYADRDVFFPDGHVSLDRNDGRVLRLVGDQTDINGVWDLPMAGAVRNDIEHKCQMLRGGPEVFRLFFGGVVVKNSDGSMWGL